MIHISGHNYNSREIIQNVFSPLIGVVTSPLAEEICHKNNLSFVEILQPFSKLPCDAHFRDVCGTSVSIKGLRLNICDLDWRPPQTTLARKMLKEAVCEANNDATKTFSVGSITIELPTAEPWFEKWRETFLTVQFPAEHEFTRHFICCLIILSSNDPDIVGSANKLTHSVNLLQSVPAQKLPKWFHPNDVLNSYVVLHEVHHGDLLMAQQAYELLRSTFGENKCFLIQLNSLNGSTPSNLPDYWTPYIKRRSKVEVQDSNSAPKTPQDSVSVTSIPTIQTSSNFSESVAATESDLNILHPLSPMQENATEAINSKFSASTESIASYTINRNVWLSDIDVDAPLAAFLNGTDVENLRHFVQDYAVRALIPYVEHSVAVLSEAITNKKGVSKSLLSATKRWFVTNKPGVGASNQNAVIYTNESVELQTRKLGDLYFMFGHYNLAFQAYHQAKRDFNADAAWQYYAGALEMAAISAFMLGTANRKTYDYMEEAIVCYLIVCKLQQFAARATLLSIECLKSARLYSEAAKQLIRMTSEESDLRSALLLEQAAYCFLATQPCMYRKYAFHAVLAGNRYCRAGQRKHSYRCYRQAYQVIQQCGWGYAEDHIQYTIAKQAHSLKKLEEAGEAFAHLLRPSSMQSALQQANILKEYIQTKKDLLNDNSDFGLYPIALPQVVQSSLRVLVTPQPLASNSLFVPATDININTDFYGETVWHKIEEMITATAANRPIVFKPTCSLFTYAQLASNTPLAVLGEPIEISVGILNTIKCSITFSEIDLLWKLQLESDEVLTNVSTYGRGPDVESERTTTNAAVKTSVTNSHVLAEHEEKKLSFLLTPKLTGLLNVVGIVGKLAPTSDISVSLLGGLYFEEDKARFHQKQNQIPFDNGRVSIKILPPVPSLNVRFSKVPEDLIAGEIVQVKILLRNTGILPIDDIYIGCECPRWITFLDEEVDPPLSILKRIKDITNEKLVKDKEIRRQHVFHLLKQETGATLTAQEAITIPMWIQAPYEKGEFKLRLLFYYSFSSATNQNMKYRLVRHFWKFNIHECLRIGATCVVSNFQSKSIGLNVQFKNENEMHHPLMIEVYINSLGTFCSKYKVDDRRIILMNSMDIEAGQLGEHCLKSGKSATIQFRLQQLEHKEDMLSIEEYIKCRMSSVDIYPTNIVKDFQTPKDYQLYSFLMKNETSYFSVNTSSEEFNHIIGLKDQHTTVYINWTAVIFFNSEQRIAHGQHFVQLRNLYESISCPNRNLSVSIIPTTLIKIYDFEQQREKARPNYSTSNNDTFHNEDDGSWELNNEFVGKRCLLEDEHFTATAKI